MKKRVYISGKIDGTTDYMERFALGSELAKKRFEGCEVTNPSLFGGVLPASMPYSCYMEVCLVALRYCDTVLMLRGWRSSKGANVERAYALSLGLVVCYEDEESDWALSD